MGGGQTAPPTSRGLCEHMFVWAALDRSTGDVAVHESERLQTIVGRSGEWRLGVRQLGEWLTDIGRFSLCRQEEWSDEHDGGLQG